ncbi:MAG TPA: phage tail protein [Methylomusa anaerophila]|uniref:Prophage minor tail protein Z n=1 Tax=Methylomusa anaerophila TaxID=1930071 RepID=A0A348AJ03_9FIRM|nr:phage tail protein [Methylomusa anaerophila]BBB91051.1 Prophage minor tail protein Z [Methylomusa anaerophila]HML88925.1 phage tail protein [Methylomusa anaerophila]
MIELTDDQLKRAEQLLKHLPGALPKAVANAINRASESARAEAVRKASEEYVIRPGRVRETIDIAKASPAILFARVRSKGRPRALTYFQTTPKQVPKKRPRGQLVAQVKRSEGGGSIKSAFLARMKSGHLGVFNRTNNLTSTGKVELVQRYGPSVPQMLENPTIQQFVEQKAMETLEKRFDHELDRLLKG